MKFELLNKEKLELFINSALFSTLKNLPISKHRALSQLLNPRAEKEDILLILAYDQGELVGYAGVLPDLLFSQTGNAIKFGWLSCIWVDDSKRGKKNGGKLLEMALEAWKGYLIAADYAPETERMYSKTEVFAKPIKRSGIRLYIRMNLHVILPPKKLVYQKTTPILLLADKFINTLKQLHRLPTNRKTSFLQSVVVTVIDDEILNFISTFRDAPLFQRGINELNWILHHPWILSSSADEDSRRYYFSSVDKSFDFYAIKLQNSRNELVAFLIFSKRNRTLKLPFCYIQKDVLAEVAQTIEEYIIKWRVDTFTSFHPELAGYLALNSNVAIFKKDVTRYYMVTHTMDELIRVLSNDIQDGDGDCAFT